MHGIALIVFIIAKPAVVLLPEGQRDNSLGARRHFRSWVVLLPEGQRENSLGQSLATRLCAAPNAAPGKRRQQLQPVGLRPQAMRSTGSNFHDSRDPVHPVILSKEKLCR